MNRKTEFKNSKFYQESVWQHEVVYIKRISSGGSGGRRFRFAALVVVGHKQDSTVGVGYAKANATVKAIVKAQELAKKSAVKFSFSNQVTLPIEVSDYFKSAKLMLKPAYDGTGLRCNKVTRIVLRMLNIQNVSSKAYGTKHPKTKVLVTMKALKTIEKILTIQRVRKNSL